LVGPFWLLLHYRQLKPGVLFVFDIVDVFCNASMALSVYWEWSIVSSCCQTRGEVKKFEICGWTHEPGEAILARLRDSLTTIFVANFRIA
jgi:hypothetical protein